MADQGRAGNVLTLDSVKAVLRERGFVWHSFGHSSYDKDGKTYYWFNGSRYMGTGHGALRKQPFGWFTLDEMLAEKFAEGCR